MKSVVFLRVNETIIERLAIHCCVVILLDQRTLIETEKKEVSNRQKIVINSRGLNNQLFVNKNKNARKLAQLSPGSAPAQLQLSAG